MCAVSENTVAVNLCSDRLLNQVLLAHQMGNDSLFVYGRVGENFRQFSIFFRLFPKTPVSREYLCTTLRNLMDDKLCLTQRLIEKSISKYSQDLRQNKGKRKHKDHFFYYFF